MNKKDFQDVYNSIYEADCLRMKANQKTRKALIDVIEKGFNKGYNDLKDYEQTITINGEKKKVLGITRNADSNQHVIWLSDDNSADEYNIPVLLLSDSRVEIIELLIRVINMRNCENSEDE